METIKSRGTPGIEDLAEDQGSKVKGEQPVLEENQGALLQAWGNNHGYDALLKKYSTLQLSEKEFSALVDKLADDSSREMIRPAIESSGGQVYNLENILPMVKDLKITPETLDLELKCLFESKKAGGLANSIKEKAKELEEKIYGIQSKLNIDGYSSSEKVALPNSKDVIQFNTHVEKANEQMTIIAYLIQDTYYCHGSNRHELFKININLKYSSLASKPQPNYGEWTTGKAVASALFYPVVLPFGAIAAGLEGMDGYGHKFISFLHDITVHPVKMAAFYTRKASAYLKGRLLKGNKKVITVNNLSLEEFLGQQVSALDSDKAKAEQVKFAFKHLTDALLKDYGEAKEYLKGIE